MRKHALAGVLSLALFGIVACTPEQLDDSFAFACTAVSTADAGFQIYASSGKVSQSTIRSERLAVRAAQKVCSGPRPTNVREALAAVNVALATIARATARARQEASR